MAGKKVQDRYSIVEVNGIWHVVNTHGTWHYKGVGYTQEQAEGLRDAHNRILDIREEPRPQQ